MQQRCAIEPIDQFTLKEYTHHQNTYFGALGAEQHLSGYAGGALEEPKIKKTHKVPTSPLRVEDIPFGPPTKFCVWVNFAEVINCAKFLLHWSSRF